MSPQTARCRRLFPPKRGPRSRRRGRSSANVTTGTDAIVWSASSVTATVNAQEDATVTALNGDIAGGIRRDGDRYDFRFGPDVRSRFGGHLGERERAGQHQRQYYGRDLR